MIDYATLCRAIDDWKAGQKPSGVIIAAPKRVPTRPAEEEAVVEYSAAYDIGEPEPAETPDSTVIYQLDGENEVEEGETEAEAEAEVEGEAEADAEVEGDVEEGEADVESDDDYQR